MERDVVMEMMSKLHGLSGGIRLDLRVEAEVLESVYVSVAGNDLEIHDAGYTYFYLSDPNHAGYLPWSRKIAEEEADRCRLELVDEGEGEGVTAFRLLRRLGAGEALADAVAAVADAMDATFGRHTASTAT